jgi:hypothetical protein
MVSGYDEDFDEDWTFAQLLASVGQLAFAVGVLIVMWKSGVWIWDSFLHCVFPR